MINKKTKDSKVKYNNLESLWLVISNVVILCTALYFSLFTAFFASPLIFGLLVAVYAVYSLYLIVRNKLSRTQLKPNAFLFLLSFILITVNLSGRVMDIIDSRACEGFMGETTRTCASSTILTSWGLAMILIIPMAIVSVYGLNKARQR